MKSDHPEPERTAENINKKKGDTDFVLCGWCRHATGGLVHYDAQIETHCGLLPYDYEQKYWDTPCVIVGRGKADYESLITSHRYNIKNHEYQIKREGEKIVILANLRDAADPIPPTPDKRPGEYYNVGDSVYVWHIENWQHETVVNGYRHHDGVVNYILDDFPESRPGDHEHHGPWGCGEEVPCILKEEEYVYFQKHTEAFKRWLHLADRTYNGVRLPLADYYTTLTGRSDYIEEKIANVNTSY